MKRLICLVVLLIASRAQAVGVTMNPDPLVTPSTLVGTTSGDVSGQLQYGGGGNLHLDLVVGSCSGAGTGTFNLSPNTNISVGTSPTVTVTYSPTAAGTRSCIVNMYDSGTTFSRGTFTVTGVGSKPPIISVPTPTAFTPVRFNDAALVHTSAKLITISNNGGQTLTISSITVGGAHASDFSLTSGVSLPSNIAASSSRSWTFTFNPAAAGTRTATLTITSNDPVTPTLLLDLTGDGTTGVISVDDQSFGTIATGSSAARDITVSNIGGPPKGALVVTTAAITGGGNWFTFSGCGGGTSCTFSPMLGVATSSLVGIKCSPPAGTTAATVQNATVTFVSDTDAGGDNMSAISCTAGASTLASSMSSVTFPGQLVGTVAASQSVTITNSGNVADAVYFSLAGANASRFTVTTTSGCGTSSTNKCALGPGAAVGATLGFMPAAEGDVSASLTVSSNGTGIGMTLAGRGVDRHIALPPLITFEDTYRGAQQQLPLTIQNLGEYPVHVSDIQIAGAPVWSLADPAMTAFDVDGLSSVDVLVRFTPQDGGKAPDGMIVVTSDDPKLASPLVVLQGNGIVRNVLLDPPVINLGDRSVGVSTRLSDLQADLPVITNADTTAFTIREISIDGDAFAAQAVDGSPIADVVLEPGDSHSLDIVFTPVHAGAFEAQLALYLDDDPSPQSTVIVEARGVDVNVHGGGGCSTGGGSGPVVVLLVVGLRRRRRR